MEYTIDCTGLVKRYPDFTLGPLDIKIERGIVAGLVGANGAGKTTLIKLLLGLTSPNEGNISLFGEEIANPKNLAASIKSRIGIVLDTCSFTQASNIKDVARLGKLAYRNWDAGLFARLTKSFELDPKKQVQKLSRGMGMKLQIAFALAHHPDLLILDEATAGLDPIARDEILDILRKFMLNENHTILMSTHITSDLEKTADKIICIDHGNVLFSEQKDALCDDAGIAHLRTSQLEEIQNNNSLEHSNLRLIKREYGADILVADRFAFSNAYPNIPVDKATIDEYMNMILKGETL